MRILGLTNLYPNPFQPQRAPFNRDKFRRLAERHEVRVVAPILWTQELEARRAGAKRLLPKRQVRLDGIVVDHPRYWYTPRLFRGWYGYFFEASVRRTFLRAAREFQPDMVLATWAYPDGWAAVRLARRAGLPVVIQTHGSDVLLTDRYPSRRKRTIEALRQADGIVTVSQDMARRVRELSAREDHVRVVYNGVDEGLFHPGDPVEARRQVGLTLAERVALFVGGLELVKGVDLLLDACAKLHALGRKLTLVLIGDGQARKPLQEQVRRLGLGERVQFRGSLPQSLLPAWYRAADLLVVPSRSEGVPNVLLEAIACGTPFVATRVGGIPEVAHLGEGRLVAPEQVDELAAAIGAMLVDPPPRSATKVRDQSAAAREMSDFLETILARFRERKGPS